MMGDKQMRKDLKEEFDKMQAESDKNKAREDLMRRIQSNRDVVTSLKKKLEDTEFLKTSLEALYDLLIAFQTPRGQDVDSEPQ